jgi:hypothetical protein
MAGLALSRLNTRVLLKTPHLQAEVDYARRIVLLTRSALPFEKVEEIESLIVELHSKVPDSVRAGSAVLIDMREGPTRVHPALDPAFTRFRSETERAFSKVVVVVKTAIGKIRSDRLAETCHRPLAITDDFDEGLELSKPDAQRRIS